VPVAQVVPAQHCTLEVHFCVAGMHAQTPAASAFCEQQSPVFPAR
jgi:hypothetical protein